MVLYYAMGGGLGHLSRAKKVLHTLAITDFIVLTASPFANQLFTDKQILTIPSSWNKRPSKIMTLILGFLDANKVESFFVDTFPFGILGELNLQIISEKVPVHYVVRYIKWQQYKSKLQPSSRFEKIYLVDQLGLEEEHKIFLKSHANQIRSLNLKSVPQFQKLDLSILALNQINCLVVHATPEKEVRMLIDLAQEKARLESLDTNIILCTLEKIEGYVCLNTSSPHSYYPYVDYIVSGCGFNTMLETEVFKNKHFGIPFPRKYDDQYLRAQQRKNNIFIDVSNEYFC